MARGYLLASIILLAMFLPSRLLGVTGSVTVFFDPGTQQRTTGPLIGTGTTGASMAGMSVRFVFADGSTQVVPWTATGPSSGSAELGSLSISESGDTFTSNWRLVNNTGVAVVLIEIDGGPGATLFDTTFGGDFGTAGSGNGRTFSVVSGLTGLTVNATYIDVTGVQGAEPVGDLFRRLLIAFANPEGFESGRTLVFRADTDSLEAGSDVDPILCCEPWDNGVFDRRNAQESVEIAYPAHRRVVADDFSLCDGEVHQIFEMSAELLTDAIAPKARVYVYEDCSGRPGRQIASADILPSTSREGLVTVTETSSTFDGLRIVRVRAAFERLFLVGGQYWVTFAGYSGTGNPNERFLWGTSGDAVVKGQGGLFFDSSAGDWQPIASLCCGCTDFNFCVDGESCKSLIGSHTTPVPTIATAFPSFQPSSGTIPGSRAAVRLVAAPCSEQVLCFVDAYLWTNCSTAELEIFDNTCTLPGENSVPRFSVRTRWLETVGPTSTIDGITLSLKRARFANFDTPTLPGGRNYWLSVHAVGDGSMNARGFVASAESCRFSGCVPGLAASRTQSPASPRWSGLPAGSSLAIAVAGRFDPVQYIAASPSPSVPHCSADRDGNGVLSVNDLFAYLNSFFLGCP